MTAFAPRRRAARFISVTAASRTRDSSGTVPGAASTAAVPWTSPIVAVTSKPGMFSVVTARIGGNPAPTMPRLCPPVRPAKRPFSRGTRTVRP
ncbi:MAG: hypothetical protein AUG44_02635 [Actinobacteria bacterium 13_1_20CM_3_71_11]|nr:MAG: hypothetical protein AUG44_02635 [Actinobacteria bacterium 13_1_20CM_3_71_11]